MTDHLHSHFFLLVELPQELLATYLMVLRTTYISLALTEMVQMLAQHNAIVERMNSLVAESSDDVRVLARLWQLRNKMESVGSAGSYGEHLQTPLNLNPRCIQQETCRPDPMVSARRVRF